MAKKTNFKDIRVAAEAAGWSITQSRGGHLKWKSPQGQVVVSAATPSDHRAVKNHLSLLRRYGLDLR